MKKTLLLAGLFVVGIAAFTSDLRADGYDEDALAYYTRLFARSTPGKAQLGVDVYPRSIFRKESSVENMSGFLPGNVAGRPPAVYYLEFYVPRGDYSDVVLHYSKFADPATSPVETLISGNMRRTYIELARDGAPKQRILVYDRTDGYGCTLSSQDDEGRGTGPCVLVHIITRGEASWAAAGRGQPRPVAAAPKANNQSTQNNNSNNQPAGSSNNTNNNNNNTNNNANNCAQAASNGANAGRQIGGDAAWAAGGDWRAHAAGRALGGLLGAGAASKKAKDCSN